MKFNELTDAQEEMLVITMEECGELAQAVSKIFRHRKDGRHRDGTLNLAALQSEAADVIACIAILVKNGFLDGHAVNCEAVEKLHLLKEDAAGLRSRIHHITPEMIP